MKKLVNLIAASLFSLVLLSPMAYADKWKGEIRKGTDQPKPAFCVPASGSSELNLNNVRARINTGGDMWWDFEVSKYEIPKNSRKTSMFAASLWIGGLDVNGQLKLAALRYRQIGNDYWTGPLTIDGTASIDQNTCKKYDKHWKISRAEVEQFKAFMAGLPVPQGYTVPRVITDWPAHPIDGNTAQSFYLAPFYDANADNVYKPSDGDYPYYDFTNELCPTNPANLGNPRPTMESDTAIQNPANVKGGMLVDQVLKGDQTIWWVFNDKGAAHTESRGEPIGLEIRAQAFAFATNDEINNMTFYSYEIINRSTYTLTQTYFSQWVDTDLGDGYDDFVGCDVRRGLGYCYNGDDEDGTGKYNEYGKQPPAIGVDFFQGPYMDPDGHDNPNITELNTMYAPASLWGHDGELLPNHIYTTTTGRVDTADVIVRAEAINGVNFGDGIVDNERFGMRRFVFHNNTTGGLEASTDPDIAIEYYNLLRGIWKDNNQMCYGGNAHPLAGGDASTPCAFMFPGDTDPWNWGTFGKNPGAGYSSSPWTEESASNSPNDRRFMQSAGPFTLYPGAVNYITVGIPWARAASGGPFASVQLLRRVDDKCQILFDNCFKVLDGPDAPLIAAQELDKEVILYIDNGALSNNKGEKYLEFDPSIPQKSEDGTISYDQYYHFEGYQIFQLSDASVSISEIYDADKARLAFQCDVKNFDAAQNGVGQLVNYTYNDEIGGNIPQIMVQGGNEGIKHSIKLTEDLFATGDKRLVNHKKYYYVAIAYAYNNFAPYSQDANAIDGLKGQKRTYLAGRKASGGSAITPIVVIPHIPTPEANGTSMQASYGDQPQITRIEGQGNGGLVLDLTQSSIDKIMSGAPWKIDDAVYEPNKGPLQIKVIDPLNVKPGEFLVKFTNPTNATEVNSTFHWEVSGESLTEPILSNESIALGDEQLITDLGISIQIQQFNFEYIYPEEVTKGGPDHVFQTKFLESSISFANTGNQWITGVPDLDGDTPLNWIHSGSLSYGDEPSPEERMKSDFYLRSGQKKWFYDSEEQYEKVVDRTWAPFHLCANSTENPGLQDEFSMIRDLSKLCSVDIVFTSDRSKWTRCPVIETCDDSTRAEGHARKLEPRRHPSVNQDGVADGTGDGMGWFPGYAINVETGERLNIMFGEDSWLTPFNGNDMKFNPTSNIYSSTGNVIFGGKHFVYIMGHQNNLAVPDPTKDCPAYDQGAWIMDKFNEIRSTGTVNLRKKKKTDLFTNAMWTSIPISVPGTSWMSSDCKVRIRVARPYKRYLSTLNVAPAVVTNDNFPLYKFNTTMFATQTDVNDVAKSALDLINVVPNPYYGFSMYETNQLDNRIKIVNLPDKCTISIYAVNGSLVRQIKKDDNTITSVDWDLKNHAGIPISGGIYIIHVKADGIGEKVIKWFGALRPTDLNSF